MPTNIKPQIDSRILAASSNLLRYLIVLDFAGFKISKDILTVLKSALIKSLAPLTFRNKINYLFAVKTLRNSIYLLFSMCFLNACTSKPKQTTHPKIYTVEIKQMQFQPEELWLRTGDTVIFINNDIVAHNVTEQYNAWASQSIERGESWRMAIGKHEDYFCTIHPMMKGKLRIMNLLQ